MRGKLKLPVGYENFVEIRETGFYYVDKTKLIEQLLEAPSKVTLFTRPRRFGKTLNMSMLKYFFENGTDPQLFEGLHIAQRKDLCEAYMGQYPVIFWSLKSVEGLSFDRALNQFIYLIGTEAKRFSFLCNIQKLSADDIEDYQVLTHKEKGMYTMSFDDQIQEWFSEKIQHDANTQQFYKELQAGNATSIETYLNEMMNKTISVYDTKTNQIENSCHMFLNGILCANGNWYTRSNVESGDGFADIIIETEDIDEGIVIEVKHCERYVDMEKYAQQAIEQIKAKRYAAYLQNELRTKIHIYGIAFCKKRCKVIGEAL